MLSLRNISGRENTLSHNAQNLNRIRYAEAFSKVLMKVASEYRVGVISIVRTSFCACAFSTMSFMTPTHCRVKHGCSSQKEGRAKHTHLIEKAGELVSPLEFTLAMNVINDTSCGDKQINVRGIINQALTLQNAS